MFFSAVSHTKTGKTSHCDECHIWQIRKGPCLQSQKIQDLWGTEWWTHDWVVIQVTMFPICAGKVLQAKGKVPFEPGDPWGKCLSLDSMAWNLKEYSLLDRVLVHHRATPSSPPPPLPSHSISVARTYLRRERYCENKVSFPRIQHNDPNWDLTQDSLIQSPGCQLFSHCTSHLHVLWNYQISIGRCTLSKKRQAWYIHVWMFLPKQCRLNWPFVL